MKNPAITNSLSAVNELLNQLLSMPPEAQARLMQRIGVIREILMVDALPPTDELLGMISPDYQSWLPKPPKVPVLSKSRDWAHDLCMREFDQLRETDFFSGISLGLQEEYIDLLKKVGKPVVQYLAGYGLRFVMIDKGGLWSLETVARKIEGMSSRNYTPDRLGYSDMSELLENGIFLVDTLRRPAMGTASWGADDILFPSLALRTDGIRPLFSPSMWSETISNAYRFFLQKNGVPVEFVRFEKLAENLILSCRKDFPRSKETESSAAVFMHEQYEGGQPIILLGKRYQPDSKNFCHGRLIAKIV